MVKLLEASIDEVVEALTREYLAKLVKKLRSVFISYLHAAVHLYRQRYYVRPTLELNVRELDDGVEVYARVYFDSEEIARLRNAIYSQVVDNRLRIKSYADVVKMRVKGSSSELYALLSSLRSSPPESHREAGVPREEVRDQERGSATESSQQGDLRGVQVDEEDQA
jgi:hypothetical protein